MRRKWTEEDTATLLRMKREGHSFRDIAAVLGRTVKSTITRAKATNESAEQREIRRQRRRQSYVANRPPGVKAHVHERPEGRPTKEMLAERDRRLALPVPPFGDPLPGYSALDRLTYCNDVVES